MSERGGGEGEKGREISITKRRYRRSGNFCVKELLNDKFLCKEIFVGTTPYRVSVTSAH